MSIRYVPKHETISNTFTKNLKRKKLTISGAVEYELGSIAREEENCEHDKNVCVRNAGTLYSELRIYNQLLCCKILEIYGQIFMRPTIGYSLIGLIYAYIVTFTRVVKFGGTEYFSHGCNIFKSGGYLKVLEIHMLG